MYLYSFNLNLQILAMRPQAIPRKPNKWILIVTVPLVLVLGNCYSYFLLMTIRFNTAVAELNSGQLDACLRHLQAVLMDYPSMSECYFIMGKAYIKMNDYAKAIIALEKAASLVKRGHRLEVDIIDLFTSLYDAYVGLIPPDHNYGIRMEEQMLSLYPSDLRQLFNYYHIKQYVSSLNGLVPLKRRSIRALSTQHNEYEQAAKNGMIPPLTPIRASVMVSMEEQNEVNSLYREYILSQTKSKQFKHKPVKNRISRAELRVGIVSGDMYFSHPMMHLMRRGFRFMRVRINDSFKELGM